jgi:aminoglycoside phosphotransferase (APT) family kinase protein
MLELTAENLASYLHGRGLIPAVGTRVSELLGGVSNRVYLVTWGRPVQRWVVKQARPQLRTAEPWFCTVERIWREMDVLQACRRLAPAGMVPEIVFEDRDQYVFGMTAAPPDARTWKEALQTGERDRDRAQHCGVLLGSLHAGSWRNDALRSHFADQSLFDELRIDPYYRSVARQCPAAAPVFEELIAELKAHPLALVHADFSPKNLLIWPGGTLLVDFETGHYGDPAFDLGFFLAHLVLKACRDAPQHAEMLQLASDFLSAYVARVEPVMGKELDALLARSWRQLGGCLWARIDGTSQVEYLPEAVRRDAIRNLAKELLTANFRSWDDVSARVDVNFSWLSSTNVSES